MHQTRSSMSSIVTLSIEDLELGEGSKGWRLKKLSKDSNQGN